jgi:hypothetical protein
LAEAALTLNLSETINTYLGKLITMNISSLSDMHKLLNLSFIV